MDKYRDHTPTPTQFQQFTTYPEETSKNNQSINFLKDIPLQVTVELGKTKKSIKEIMNYSPGSVIELDNMAGGPVNLYIGNKCVAKGEVVVIDGFYGVKVTEIKQM